MRRRFDDVIFDLDGTLVHSAPAILACFADVLAAHGLPPRVAIDNGVIGPPLLATLSRLTGLTEPTELEVLAQGFKRKYDQEGVLQTRLYPGIDLQLQRLADAGHALHIATNKRLRPTSVMLDHLGLAGLFRSVYANDRVNPAYLSKADMLAAQLEEVGLSRGRSCYVGDRGEDALAAHANGLAFCFAAWGYREPGFAGAERWPTAREPQELAAVLITMSA